MIVKRKLYSVMDEEGNQGYYLYNEATGEERMFAVMNPQFVGKAGKMAPTGFAAANKTAKQATTGFIGGSLPRIVDFASKSASINSRNVLNGRHIAEELSRATTFKPTVSKPDVNTLINRRGAMSAKPHLDYNKVGLNRYGYGTIASY